MELFLKNTQTLIGSLISTIHSIINRKKPKDQVFRIMNYELRIENFIVLPIILASLFMIQPAYAISDPLSVPNNKFGIHIISATANEASEAAQLVNSSGGNWGYVTVVMESKDRDQGKWQEFFNELRRRHLIPLVRLATKPMDGGFWQQPSDEDAVNWAKFLDSLVWPTKNRYVIVYNEPNHGKEWGNSVDPKSYAKVLDQTITALKNQNQDFFVLNAGFDASTPHQPPAYFDEVEYLKEIEEAVPGIFNKLDGWVSHSYPNPGFAGSPLDSGRGTIRSYLWEREILQGLGLTKSLPVFITETGWQHAEGLAYNRSLPTSDTVADYFKTAFNNAWNDLNIVAITPFLLNYQQAPFDHFSFKKLTGEKQDDRVLGVSFPNYYSHYQTLVDLTKTFGKPVQENQAQLIKGEIYNYIVAGQSYDIKLTFKNTGQSIWSGTVGLGQVKLVATLGGRELGISDVAISGDQRIEPGQEYTFDINIKAPQQGSYMITLNLLADGKQFDSPPVEFKTEVKSPVILIIKSGLQWKNNFAGEYLLNIAGTIGETVKKVKLSDSGQSDQVEARELLPGYKFDFKLQKDFYQSKAVNQTLQSGVNILDFGTLQPDILSAILHPAEIWKLLPFSNH